MTADDLKAQGNKAFSAGDYETAIKFFTQGIEIDSQNHVLYSNRSASYASLQQYDNALQDAEKTISIKPDWPKGYSRKGAALHGLGKLDEAAQAYKDGLKYDPSNGQLTKALEEVEASMSNDFSGPASLFGPDVWGKIAMNPKLSPFLSQPDLVAKIQEIQKNPNALNMHMQDPRLMTIMLGLMGLDGQVATNAEDAEIAKAKAQADLDARANANAPPKPKTPEPEPEPEPELTEEQKKRNASNLEKDKGNAAYKKRKFEEALKFYEAAWAQDETNVAVLSNKAAVLFEMEKYEETIKVCEQAVEVGRELRVDYKLIARALGRVGSAYAKLNDYENAIKYYGKSLAEHRTPDILEKLREAEKMKKQLDEQAYINPALSDEAREKGNVHFKGHEYAEAVKHYTEAIKRNPQDARNYSNRAACYTKLMALPEADKDCDEAIRIDPNFVKAYIRKAAIMFAKKDNTKCIEVCNLALEKDVEQKHTAEIQGQLQKAYYAVNQTHGGTPEETYKQAMQNPEVAKIMTDPVMQTILQQMQQDPGAIKNHMANPTIAAKIRTLINAGIIQTR